jgi:argininosuccinate lyase
VSRSGNPGPPGPEGGAGPGSEGQGERRLWGGRFAAGPAPALEELNRSLGVDHRLWREDIEGSRAWVRALAGAGILTAAEADELDSGLLRVAGQIPKLDLDDAPDEDIHSLVERLLYHEIGDLAGKLHTGRSRNDQVATDTRLWALRHGRRIEAELQALQAALHERAATAVDVLMPAYTHVRRAQPVRAAHWLLAHFWAFQRDRERLRQALDRVAVLPLGSGAIAGSGFPVDRALLQQELGFRAVSENSIDAVGDRDWVCELVFVCALVAAHLSRLAEDLILFSSQEFGFVLLPEAYTTGSSLMPQKRNPDGLELARGKAARLAGDAAAALALLKGLPSGYQKDLQEDKALLFGAYDAMLLLLPTTRETIAGLVLQEPALSAAAEDEAALATDIADELVRRGVPFREAHSAVGALLRSAEAAGQPLRQLEPAQWLAAHQAFASGIPQLSAAASVEARSLAGGTGRAAVLAQLEAARASLT